MNFYNLFLKISCAVILLITCALILLSGLAIYDRMVEISSQKNNVYK